MKRIVKWLGLGLAGLAGLLVLSAAGIFLFSTYLIDRSHAAKAEPLAAPSAALLADAPRQARILGCVSCHGEGLKGRVMFDAPYVARINAPNLAEIASRASDQQLAAAIRQGIGHDGRALFVMPSPQYSRLGDGEVAALIAFIRAQNRSPGGIEPISIGPLGRLGVVTGKFRPSNERIEEYRTRAPIELGAAHRLGRDLAAKDCSECHGPALEGEEIFAGRTPDLSIVGAYDEGQFRTLLRTGIAPGNRKLGLMTEVSEKDFAHLSDAEIKALYDYLRARAEKLAN